MSPKYSVWLTIVSNLFCSWPRRDIFTLLTPTQMSSDGFPFLLYTPCLFIASNVCGYTYHKEKPIKCQKDKWYHELVLSCHHPRETHCIVAKTSQLLVYLLNPEVSPQHCNATSNNGHTSLSFTVEEQFWHPIWSLLDPQTFLPLAFSWMMIVKPTPDNLRNYVPIFWVLMWQIILPLPAASQERKITSLRTWGLCHKGQQFW